jgi:hypothetical protein
MKPGAIVNATFNNRHCIARITGVGKKYGETFFHIILISPCVMDTGTIPAGTKTWVWPEMVTLSVNDAS